MNIILCFLPVILFLAFLFLLDSFNLAQIKTLISCLLWGIFCAVAGYYINTFLAKWMAIDYRSLSRYVGPVIEESLKTLFVFYLIYKKKIGFMIDAAIYGFAIGAGFSLIENFYFLFNAPPGFNLLTLIIRGIGTASMHGGCTSFFAALFIVSISRSENRFTALLPGLLLAFLLHSGFNHFPFSPVVQTLLVILVLPVIFIFVFRFSNTRLQKWLEIEFDSEVEILTMIRKGKMSSTKTGLYLLTVKERFSPETIVDMYCYISLYLELSIKAKRNLMLKENEFPIIIEEDLELKLKELDQLRKQIGKIGELTLAPLIRMNYRNLWKLNQLMV
jgi:RsiW-degrading membrane proteinase PrsW (M82 family)